MYESQIMKRMPKFSCNSARSIIATKLVVMGMSKSSLSCSSKYWFDLGYCFFLHHFKMMALGFRVYSNQKAMFYKYMPTCSVMAVVSIQKTSVISRHWILSFISTKVGSTNHCAVYYSYWMWQYLISNSSATLVTLSSPTWTFCTTRGIVFIHGEALEGLLTLWDIDSWHVYNKDNIERVRKDEAEAEAEAKKKQDRVILAVSCVIPCMIYANYSSMLPGKWSQAWAVAEKSQCQFTRNPR